MYLFSLFLILAIVVVRNSDALCGVCYANGIECNTKNTFHVCYDGVPDKNVTYSCPKKNHVCTKFGVICEDPNEVDIKPACGDTSLCGVCTGVPNGGFTCTSRTTMTMCLGEVLSQQRGSCPRGYLCDPKNITSPCQRSCFVDESAICDVAWPIDVPEPPPNNSTTAIPVPTPTSTESTATPTPTSTTTTTSTTTETSTETSTATPTTTTTETSTATPTPTTTTTETSTATPTTTPATTTTSTTTETTTSSSSPTTTLTPSATVCNQQNSAGRFSYLDVSDCSGYVNCFWKSGILRSNSLPCPTGRYFNRNTRTCEIAKPVWCR